MAPRLTFALAAILATLCVASAVRVQPIVPANAHVEGDGELCVVCEFATKYVDGFLEKNGTTDKVVEFFLDDICPELPGEASQMCSTYAPLIVPYVLTYLEKELSSGKLCSPFCSSQIAIKTDSNDGDDMCSMCEQFAGKVHDFLSQPGEADKILGLATEACKLLGDAEKKCEDDIKTYGPLAIQYAITVTADPQNACSMIHLC